MPPSSHPASQLAAIAARQHGVFAHTQARRCGYSDRAIRYRLATGQWVRILPRTYRFAASQRSWLQTLAAACLWAGPGAVTSHRAAAALLGLDVDEGPIEVTVPRKLRPPAGIVAHRSNRLPASDVTSHDGIPVTTVTRTLIDLGAVCGDETVEVALDSALRQGLTSIPYLRKRLADVGRSGQGGVGMIRRLLSLRDVDMPPQSPLATRVVRLLRKGRLPRPVNEHVVRLGDRFRRLDLAYPERKLAIECHSVRWHFGQVAWERDILRDEELRALGWTVLYVTYRQMQHDAEAVLDRIRTALGIATLELEA